METTERLDSIDNRLEKLVATSEKQQQSVDRLSLSVERLSLSIERLTLVFTNQARDISDIRSATMQLLESSRLSQENIQTSNYLAQRNLEAVRDLIEELRNKGNI